MCKGEMRKPSEEWERERKDLMTPMVESLGGLVKFALNIRFQPHEFLQNNGELSSLTSQKHRDLCIPGRAPRPPPDRLAGRSAAPNTWPATLPRSCGSSPWLRRRTSPHLTSSCQSLLFYRINTPLSVLCKKKKTSINAFQLKMN